MALIVGETDDAVRSWTRGRLVVPSHQRAPVAVYSFQDVTEGLVVGELLRRGVDRADIRTTRVALEERYGRWPFIRAELFTETVTPKPVRRGVLPDEKKVTKLRVVVVVQELDVFWEFSRRAPAQSFNQYGREPLDDMVEVLRRGGRPSVERNLHHIEIDPERMSGSPTIRGLRLEVEFVASLASSEAGLEELREDFELSDEQIADAVAWWEAAEANTLVGM